MESNNVDIKLYQPTAPQLDLLNVIHNVKPVITLANFGRQTGKAEHIDNTLYTDRGTITMGDVNVGDKIFDDKGELTTVLAIHPQGETEMMEVTFNDGTNVKVNPEHLWEVVDHHNNTRVLDTEYLSKYYKREVNYKGRVKREFPFKIKLNKAVQYSGSELPVDAYTLGLLIGDGSTTSAITLTTADKEILDYIPYTVTGRKDKLNFGILGIAKDIKDLKLNCTSWNKFIPTIYKVASIEDRMSMLQGLMDTDGTIDLKGDAEYYTVSKRLAEDVAELARSLGLYAKVLNKNGRYKGEVHKSFRVRISYDDTFSIFRIERKRSLLRNDKNAYKGHKRIVDIKRIENGFTQCISVSNDSHLYLTNDYTVTHNTYASMIDALYQGMNGKQQKILFISPTYDNNRRIMTDIDTLFEDHKEMKGLIFESIRYKEQEYVFKNTGSVLSLRSSEQGDTLRGRKAHKIYIDEAAFINESTIVEILLPMITRTNGSMVITSTPNGRNWFYEWFLKGQESHNDFDSNNLVSIQRDYRDLGDEEVNKIIDVFKDIMTSDQFNREVLAQFITDDTLFSNVDNCITNEVIEIEDGDELFIGVDIGVSNDFTVITVMNQRYEVIEIDNFNMREDKLTHQEFKDRMMAMYYKYFKYLVAMYIEKNNQELLIEELEDSYKDSYKIYPLGMQTETKGVVISNLRFLFDKMRISIPDNSVLINELYGYKAKRSALSGRLQYSNKGVDHDDHVMSLAIAAYAVLEETGAGVITTY